MLDAILNWISLLGSLILLGGSVFFAIRRRNLAYVVPALFGLCAAGNIASLWLDPGLSRRFGISVCPGVLGVLLFGTFILILIDREARGKQI